MRCEAAGEKAQETPFGALRFQLVERLERVAGAKRVVASKSEVAVRFLAKGFILAHCYNLGAYRLSSAVQFSTTVNGLLPSSTGSGRMNFLPLPVEE